MKLKTRTKKYDLLKRTYIMGILNITPDSFSDGGSYDSVEKAVAQAKKLEAHGADIIDVGGESTRPDHDPVSEEEEISRVVPMIKAIKKEINIPISIDTYKAGTAKQALKAGAEIINDVWGAKRDPEMANIAAENDVPIILMHNRTNMEYTNLIEDMKIDLQESIDIALSADVPRENIILDPGIGFAKTKEHNLMVMNQLEAFHAFNLPLLLGTSRKRFIGSTLDISTPEDRDIGTGATTCLGISKGVHIIRVHNVEMTAQLTKMMDAMLQRERG
jgi:dihydropteroate synthase